MENSITRAIYSHMPPFVQNILCTVAGYTARRQRYGKDFFQLLDFLGDSQWYSKSDFERLQYESLQELLSYCYKFNSFYREQFKKLGLSPSDFRDLSDLRKLPIIDKEIVRASLPGFISKDANLGKLVKGHTSGSTGAALPILHTKYALAFEFATVWRLRRRYGLSLSDKYATFAGRLIVPQQQNPPPFWRNNWAFNQTLFSVYHMSPENLSHYAEKLRTTDFKYYRGYPSAIYLLAEYILDNGIDFDNPPGAVFTSSETLFDYQRQAIEKAFKTKVFDRYGNTEFCASMIECEQGNYHVDMEFGIVEVAPLEETDEYVEGQLICTGFANRAMPFIRYQIGDVVTLSKQRCPCGRESMVVKEIQGRIEDYIVTPPGRRIGRIDHAFKDAVHVKESQIVQECINSITVKLITRPGYSSNSEKKLMRELRFRLGPEIEINFEYVNEIPRMPNGKFRAVISKIPSNIILNNELRI